MTEEERRENIKWRIKHSREVADRARERGDMETYHKLIGYIDKLKKELLE